MPLVRFNKKEVLCAKIFQRKRKEEIKIKPSKKNYEHVCGG